VLIRISIAGGSMTLISGATRSYVRPSGQTKKGTKHKGRTPFQPSQDQIYCAAGRIVNLLSRHYGSYPINASIEKAHKVLVGAVNNRGYPLGRTPDQVAITLHAGIQALINQGKVRFEEDSSGNPVLILKARTISKAHKDKYHDRKGQRRKLAA